MSEQKTHAEVIAEMRGARTEFPFVYLMGEPDTPEVIDLRTKEITEPRKINIRRVTVKELADRLEAAHKRERCDCAKLREALDRLAIASEGFLRTHSGQFYADTMEALGKARAALAAPPRNCDVGTAEEQTIRFKKFCLDNRTENDFGCGDCPCYSEDSDTDRCGILWEQMPYKEGGAK